MTHLIQSVFTDTLKESVIVKTRVSKMASLPIGFVGGELPGSGKWSFPRLKGSLRQRGSLRFCEEECSHLGTRSCPGCSHCSRACNETVDDE